MISIPAIRFAGKPRPEPVFNLKASRGVMQLQPQSNDIVVGYRPDNKDTVQQALQQLNPKDLKEENSFRFFRLQVNAGKATKNAWAAINNLLQNSQVPFASPVLKWLGTAESLVPRNQISVTFKKPQSDKALATFSRQYNVKLVKTSPFDPEYRFELAPRPWDETLKLINALQEQPKITAASVNFLHFTPCRIRRFLKSG